MKQIKKNKKAFTLLELVISLAIFSFLIMGATYLIINSLKYNNILWDQLESQKEGRKVLQDLVNILRRAEDSSLGGYAIVSSGDNEIIFYANVDSDNLREKVRFWLDGETIKKGITKPTGNPLSYGNSEEKIVEIAHYVKNLETNTPLFLYFDENYIGNQNPLVQPVDSTKIRVVKVQLEIEKDEEKSPVPLHLESIVQIRNLKEN
ncbi:MAG: prepilin-type N-terminal cleavage/methylation domain-containing protein [Patescibacteria group bacterium]